MPATNSERALLEAALRELAEDGETLLRSTLLKKGKRLGNARTSSLLSFSQFARPRLMVFGQAEATILRVALVTTLCHPHRSTWVALGNLFSKIHSIFLSFLLFSFIVQLPKFARSHKDGSLATLFQYLQTIDACAMNAMNIQQSTMFWLFLNQTNNDAITK